MSKSTEMSEIMYILKLHCHVDFEVDDKSYFAERKIGCIIISGQDDYLQIVQGGLSEARKAISKLGKKMLCL
jgi:hypothetical protein